MSRLTYKDTKVSGGYNAVDTDEYACVVKLGKLEDLEEEIGVNNLIEFLEWCVKFRNNFINCSFDDMIAFYKKTWWLKEDKSE